MRKLKEALKNQPDNEKSQDRLRKTVECMTELKSLKCVDIIRTLLLQEGKNHKTVLTNGRATPDEIAIAMLGLNKVMQMLVATFKKALDLSNKANVNWRIAILETSKRRLKLERTEEKRRKRKELKEQKLQTRNRLEWLEQNQPGQDNCEANAGNINTVAGKCVVERQLNKDNHVKPKLKTKTTLLQTPKVQAKSKKRKDEQTELVKHTKLKSDDNKKQPKKVVVPKVENKSNHTDAAVPLKHNETTAIENKAAFNDNGNRSKKPEKERPTHVVDPFFITESGQPYLSTAVVLSDDSNNEADDDEHQNSMERHKHKPLVKKQDYNNTRFNERHPSWLSKEQQTPVISNFKGKKTKFSENGDIAETSIAQPEFTAPAPAPANTEGMHPSWVAKQKLKPKIAAFTGKKIKFDD